MKALLKIADEHNIPIVDMKLNGKEEAISESENGYCIIAIDPRKVKSHADLKVKSAHELGHCITDSFYDADCPIVPRGRIERRADIWAIQNTVPYKLLLEALKDGDTEVWQLAERFTVTEQFMVKVLDFYGMWNGD